MKNSEVSRIFREIAMLLELKGDNPFRIRAYEKAALNIDSLSEDLETRVKENTLTSIPGIGEDLAGKIKEIVSTGTLTQYEHLKEEIPSGVLKMLEIPGLGPKTVKAIYSNLKIDTIEKLEEAAKQGKLRVMEGIREKTEENILRGIELVKKGKERLPLYFAMKIADSFLKELKILKEVKRIEAAGSLRRKKETIRDIDILVVSKNPCLVMGKFTKSPLVKEVLSCGQTKSSVISHENNMQVDLRVVKEKSFGSALMYFTGSKEFNIKFRQTAIKKGYKVNEYGVFSHSLEHGKEIEKWAAGKTEEDIFSLMDMAYIPAELREDRGEIEAAEKNSLPPLLELKDIKGDLHVHSKYSDGSAAIEDIAKEAQSFGYEYIGVSDHSQSLKVANGLSIERVPDKIEEIKKINQELKKIRLLCGTEVDVSSEGKLDYPDSVLKEFDFVIAAIHSGFKQSMEQLTKRVISAIKNKYVNFIAHPTGGMWGIRETYDLDFDEIFKAASDYNVAFEINCHPQRLDFNDINAMKAKKRGVKLVLGTDSHILEQLKVMELGVSAARRAWLNKQDVINCMELDKLLKWLEK